MRPFLNRFCGDRRGATAVEYALIMALIMLAIVASVRGVANKTTGMWNNVATTVLQH
jgi:pilus assembly protein Flp/PilA